MSSHSAIASIGRYSADDSIVCESHLPKFNGLHGGVRKLMAALLLDGIEAYVRAKLTPAANRDSDYKEVCYWVETDDPSYIFSFDVVCESIGINPHYLRLGIDRYIASNKRQKKNCNQPVWKKIRRERTPRQED